MHKKPLFSVVIDEEYLKQKSRQEEDPRSIFEQEHHRDWKEFKERVSSNVVRFWKSPDDIKLAIMETLNDYGRRNDLVGWVRGDSAIDTTPLAEEIARLSKENAELRSRQNEVGPTYAGLTFSQMYSLLEKERLDLSDVPDREVSMLREVARELGDSEPRLVHVLWLFQDYLTEGHKVARTAIDRFVFDRLHAFGLLVFPTGSARLSDVGREFLNRFLLEKGTESARKLLSEFKASRR